jgi:hypothetical protein
MVAMWPDVNLVDGEYLQSGYELVLIEKTDVAIETTPTYPINYSSSSGVIDVALDAGSAGLLSLSFSLNSVEPTVDLQVLVESASVLDSAVSRMATFNPETGELFFPELAIDGDVALVNARFALTDAANLIFTLQSMNAN